MKKAVLDTSVLIRHWLNRRGRMRGEVTVAVVKRWARELIELERSDAIVTPVYVEMIAGVSDKRDLLLTKAFLNEFRCIDAGLIPEQDWRETVRLAQRVPHDSKPRQLGDCLVRAIANRLKYNVTTFDTGFAR